MCRWDNGPDTPIPAPTESEVLDFPGYLRFVGGLTHGEWLNCYRREVFDSVRYPGGRAYEGSFHLAAASRWRFWMCTDRLSMARTDARNRITASPPPDHARRQLRDAVDGAADAEAVLHAWSGHFRAHAPRLLRKFQTQRIMQCLLADRRLEALDAFLRAAPEVQRSPRLLAFVGLGLLDPRVLAYTQSFVSAGLRRVREARPHELAPDPPSVRSTRR